jgi:hypothetical protein
MMSFRVATVCLLLTVGALALTLAGTSTSPSAAAEVPYAVHITVPATVKDPSKFLIRVFGHSANLSRVSAFIDTEPCATTAALERTHPHADVTRLMNVLVVHGFSKVAIPLAKEAGQFNVCAYLTGTVPQLLPRAAATGADTFGSS